MQERTKRRIQSLGPPALCHLSATPGYFLFFAEEYGRRNWSEADYRYNLELFREIGRFWTYREQLGFWPAFLNIGGNIRGISSLWPSDAGHAPESEKKSAGDPSRIFLKPPGRVAAARSKVGSFDVDDLLLNTVGAAAGYFLYWVCNQIRRKFHGKAI